jgi:UPF0716 protein FxsA
VVLLAMLVFMAAEIAAFVLVAEHIGLVLAIIVLLAVSACGPLFVRRAGTGVIEHARARIQQGETPDREVLDGVVVLLGGVLICVPGFIGDALGLLLLLAPVRHFVIRMAGRHLARRVATVSVRSFGLPGFPGRPRGTAAPGGPVVDAATHDRSHPAEPPRPALPADRGDATGPPRA